MWQKLHSIERAMQNIRIRLSNRTRNLLLEKRKIEKAKGNLKMTDRILIVLAVDDGYSYDSIARFLKISALYPLQNSSFLAFVQGMVIRDDSENLGIQRLPLR